MAGRIQDKKKMTYPEFLRKIGISLDGIVSLGFRFSDENISELYHYRLMKADIGQVLYDRVREKAVVCLPSGSTEEARRLAAELGADEFTALLML